MLTFVAPSAQGRIMMKKILIVDDEEKIKKKESSNKNQSQEDLNKKKKNIYKNKTKLQSNKEETASNVVIYKEGMSVSDLADELGISASEIVKKLIGMGLMISSSQAISFDDASVVVLEYNKELDAQYPSSAALESPISVSSNIDLEIISKNAPYIFVEKENEEYDVIRIIGTPQQYCPIVVEDPNGNTYSELKSDSFVIDEMFNTIFSMSHGSVKSSHLY